jgi:hypothetical protein
LVDGQNIGRVLYQQSGSIINASTTTTTAYSKFAEFTFYLLPYENVIYAYYNSGVSGSALGNASFQVNAQVYNLNTTLFSSLGALGTLVTADTETILASGAAPITVNGPGRIKLDLSTVSTPRLLRVIFQQRVNTLTAGTLSYKIFDLAVHVTRDIFNQVAPLPVPTNPSS